MRTNPTKYAHFFFVLAKFPLDIGQSIDWPMWGGTLNFNSSLRFRLTYGEAENRLTLTNIPISIFDLAFVCWLVGWCVCMCARFHFGPSSFQALSPNFVTARRSMREFRPTWTQPLYIIICGCATRMCQIVFEHTLSRFKTYNKRKEISIYLCMHCILSECELVDNAMHRHCCHLPFM